MLKVLIQKELRQIWVQSFLRGGKTAKNGKKRSSKTMTVIWIFLIVYLLAIFTFVAWQAGMQFLYLPGLGWLYYMLLGAAAILFGALGSVFSTYSSLYLAKDNDLLLSMPIPLKDVILSRLASVYLMGLFYSGSISLPAAVMGLILAGFSFARLVGSLLWVLLISLIVLAMSCLLGWVVAKVSVKLKRKSFLLALLALVCVGLYYVVYFRMINHMPELIDSVLRYGENVRSSFNPLFLFGRTGEGDWLAMALCTAAVCLVLGLIWLVLQRSFLSVATASDGGKKAVYREKAVRQGSASSALWKKEWQRFTSSAGYMLNTGLGVVFLLGLGVFLLIKGRYYLDLLEQVLPGLAEYLPVVVCAACCLMAGMVDISAPSVSLEGKTLWQLRSLPVTAWQVLQAKLLLHLSIAILPTLFCVAVTVALIQTTLAQKLLIFAISLLFMALIALLGLALGLKMPNLNWTNEMIPIKQSLPVMLTLFSGMIFAGLLAGLYIWFGWRVGVTGWLSAAALLLLAIDAALFLWLRGPGARRFEELE